MRLEHLVDVKGRLTDPYLDAGTGPFGARYIYNTADGSFEGPRLKGRFLPGGGDWPLADDDGTMRLDIRLALETDDGAVIYLENQGVWRHLPEDARDGKGGMYIMATPRFETGDERYRWLNDYVYVAEGEMEMLEEEGLLAQVTWHIYTVVGD